MKLNVELLRKTAEYVTEHPEEWNQGFWGAKLSGGCGTTRCVAGTALWLNGESFDWYRPQWTDSEDSVTFYKIAEYTATGREIPDEAQKVLGLTDDQATKLFFDLENKDGVLRLWKLISIYSNGEIEIPLSVREKEAAHA